MKPSIGFSIFVVIASSEKGFTPLDIHKKKFSVFSFFSSSLFVIFTVVGPSNSPVFEKLIQDADGRMKAGQQST